MILFCRLEGQIENPVVMKSGRGIRQRLQTLAMSPRRGLAPGNRFEAAVAVFSCLAERQRFSVAGEICGRCATFARSIGLRQRQILSFRGAGRNRAK